ncbi:MAG TPA: NAD-dependent epimerase/dehydratase family protein [Mycobacteriales bacterium]|nr:NAD-dependent epimerase/dehydratase family protein [Mycobacteriales bacterium]
MPSAPDTRRVLVLGGTGFLGSRIAARYAAAGWRVRAIARHSAPVPDGCDLIVGDAADVATVAAALDAVDHVVDCLGCPFPAESVADPASDAAATVPKLIGVLELLRQRPGVGLTFLSSGGTVYGDPPHNPVREDAPTEPLTSYGIQKLTAEKYCRMYAHLYDVPTTVLRVSNAYGPGQQTGRGQGLVAALLEAAQLGSTVHVFGDGGIQRDYVHVDDVADACVRLTGRTAPGAIINVGFGSGHTIIDVLELVRRITGAALPAERLPDRTFDVRALVLDTTLLRGLIDWEPRPLAAGIAETWSHLTGRPDAALLA